MTNSNTAKASPTLNCSTCAPESTDIAIRQVSNARLDINGKVTEAYDFKGNLLHSTRRLASDYVEIPDWLTNPKVDDESFEGSTRYDALNRPIQSIAPHSNVARAKCNIIQPVFNDANLLERVDVWLERASEPTALLNPNNEAPSRVGVDNVAYDAKGQRLRIDYKNSASTFYSYDPLTFRLTQLVTRRTAAVFPGDDPQPPIAGWPGRQVQNLHYTFDPAGNITHIQDDAQQTIYFKNKRVEPSNDYIYDALYRLIQANGREHLGQGGASIAYSHDDAGQVGLLSVDAAGQFAPNDGNAMGTYIERYVYDAVGNFLQMQHRGSDPANAGWTRAYDYLEASLIEHGGGLLFKTSNRLTRTTLNPNGGKPPLVEPYQHDAHGNMVMMPHLGGGLPGPNMHWDYKDRLVQTNLGGGGTAYYVYDASGQRVRKVWEKAAGLIEERVYLGGFEVFRRHAGPIGANTATLERETLHVLDDKQRIALVETRTVGAAGNDLAPRQLIRYQLGNHLDSACVELDVRAQIISYEEYAPYGSTTYQAVRSQVEKKKRYRYTGKERDEDNGFYYHGARYFAPWLARWIACDPISIRGGVNLYVYASALPASRSDPTGLDDRPCQLCHTSPSTVSQSSSSPDGWLRAVAEPRRFCNVSHHEGPASAGIPISDALSRGAKAAGKLALEIFIGTVEAVFGGSAASAPENEEQARNAPESQSYAAQALNVALLLLPYEKILGYGFKGVARLLGKEAEGAATAAEREFLSELSEGVRQTGSAPTKEVAANLARGNFGERMAADSLAADGHRIVSYKPSVSGTNQAGIDIVTVKDGVAYFVDNKALTRSGNVSSVSALTTNFATNKAAVVQSLQQQLANTAIGPGERKVLTDALAAIQSGNFKRVVTNANFVTRSTQILSGVTEALQKQGIEFMDLMR
ncbi:RHS repeat-associated core domain-containing protein [Trinickia symbiotica]|uniref:RHS repeat-associated core domain-containing protein n=1 Tax=Trinickia symbiotica TaxID=863227 RepID=UPI001C62CDA6|nr:RHS repeat-associated core domain-containing protein [Trinickia symbiotica]